MTLMTRPEISLRLRSASKDSPLAVFRKCKRGKCCAGLYDVMFANTILTRQRIKNDDSFIGVFSRPHELKITKEFIL